MGDLNGRPPRTRFWAEDLTIRHERFHAGEFQTFAVQAGPLTGTWLSAQTASSVADCRSLLQTARISTLWANVINNMTDPAKEERAYGDGAASYTARAQAIRTRGDTAATPPVVAEAGPLRGRDLRR